MGQHSTGFARFGQVLKAGGARRPEEVDPGRPGPQSGDNAYPGPVVVYGPHPMAVRQASALFTATNLTSPMVRGRFRSSRVGSKTATT